MVSNQPKASGRKGSALVLGLRVAALLALLVFEPLVLGYLYHTHLEGNPILLFMRQSWFFCFFFMFLTAWVGGQYGWLTAPGVKLIAGGVYSFVEASMDAEAVFSELMREVVIFGLVFALPMGLVVSFYFRQMAPASAPEDGEAAADATPSAEEEAQEEALEDLD